MISFNGIQALAASKKNAYKSWNKSPSTAELSANPKDASRRIYDCYATVNPNVKGAKVPSNAAVFAMGSCFARELEQALITAGGNVVSVDANAESEYFRSGSGDIKRTYFHRYTPRSIWQEFMMAFDRLTDWRDDTLVQQLDERRWTDLNYCRIDGAQQDRESTLERRKIARNLVRNASRARIIIVTLGLVESWYHLPSGHYANFVDPVLLISRREDFELRVIDYAETLTCLGEILALLRSVHADGDFRLVVTVSPVPLQTTFSEQDVIIANCSSKSTLRAAAMDFSAMHSEVEYFPSFEMVTYSDPALAWRPDKVHVNREMVDHIISTFRRFYFS
jgi:hypothetical protein